MPSSVVKSFANKSGKSVSEVEKIWNDLKKEYGEDYPRITGTLKKILKINEDNIFIPFREFVRLEEERKSSEYGFTTSGHIMDVNILMNKSGLMEVEIKGKRTLAKLKSVDKLKREYDKSDWDEIEKRWKELADKKSEKVEKLLQKFEEDLNKIVIEMEKELDL